MRRCLHHTDFGQNAVFHNFARQIALIQYSGRYRSTRFLCTINYRTDHIIKCFHKENFIMSGLFSQKNLLLCGMQSNNGLLEKPFKIILKSPTAGRFSLLTSAKFAMRADDI